MQVRKQQLELGMEQQTGSKQEKEYVKPVYCHPAYLTYMQSISWETQEWMKHKLESKLLGEISITSGMQMTPPLWQKTRRTKEPLDEGERREWKSCLKTQHLKTEDHGNRSHHFMANRWANNRNSDRLYFLGLQNHCISAHSHGIKIHLLLGRKALTNLDSVLKSRESVLMRWMKLEPIIQSEVSQKEKTPIQYSLGISM